MKAFIASVAGVVVILAALPASAQTGDEAVADLCVSAEQRNAFSQIRLGLMYAEGRSIPQTKRLGVVVRARRLLEPLGYVPAAEFEQQYYLAQEAPVVTAGVN